MGLAKRTNTLRILGALTINEEDSLVLSCLNVPRLVVPHCRRLVPPNTDRSQESALYKCMLRWICDCPERSRRIATTQRPAEKLGGDPQHVGSRLWAILDYVASLLATIVSFKP